MNAKFTPGPWSRDKYGHVIDAHGESVLLRSVSIACSGKMVDEAEKNTDLIAAAPDLLEALTRLRGSFEFGSVAGIDPDGCGRALEFIKDAIAKAIGDPQ